MAGTVVLTFDKTNSQQDYQYCAKKLDDDSYVVGYIVIDKPWYSNPKDWTYYIVQNKYGYGSLCGGATDLGFEKIKVDRNTIVPYTQTAQIALYQLKGFIIWLVEYDENHNEVLIALITENDTIPTHLYDK